jgi:drug/metabolite transporter (DMT)-like permease
LETTNQKKLLIDWALLCLLAFIWGFSFFFIKQGLSVFSAYQVGALRIFISFIVFFPFLFIKKWQFPTKKIVPIVIIGLLGSGFPPFLFAMAETKISSSVAGILNSTTPVFTLIIGSLFFNSILNTKKIIGVLLGLVGSVIIIAIGENGSFNFDFGYALLVVLATLCYGTSGNLLKKHIKGEHPLLISLLAFCFMGPFAGVYLFSTDFVQVMKTNPMALESLGYLSILAIIGTALALFLFNTLVIRTNALFASTVTFLIPLVAVIIGLLAGEQLGMIHLIGLGFILLGVLITSKS